MVEFAQTCAKFNQTVHPQKTLPPRVLNQTLQLSKGLDVNVATSPSGL